MASAMCEHFVLCLHAVHEYLEPVIDAPSRLTKQRLPRRPVEARDTLSMLREPLSPSFGASCQNKTAGGSPTSGLQQRAVQRPRPKARTILAEEQNVPGVLLQKQRVHALLEL